ncbi:unnamed protein product [Adineta ricciae]|uniref:MAM domain-containing protein n=1 Tax=Adineta ricciae TaxID=249248 RepID=A0A816E3T9_ADIRI|nr:unnamed protein product [Adineta ricciae]
MQLSNQSTIIQRLWPDDSSGQYSYISDKWSWAIINLPLGEYTLLFYIAMQHSTQRLFALDNISITSCAYPPTERSSYHTLLSLSCTFDDLTMCSMTNDDPFFPPTANFTVVTGETLPNKELGPNRDHTRNSTTGGFLYWVQRLPFTASDTGRVYTSISINQNRKSCVKFAYYVNSTVSRTNATEISLSPGGCYATTVWSLALDSSEGWQTAIVPLSHYACAEKFYFEVRQTQLTAMSVAFDDIEVDQCISLMPTSTSTITSTTTVTAASTSNSRRSSSPTTTTSIETRSTISIATVSTSETTTKSNAYGLLSSDSMCLVLIYFLSNLF